MLQHRAEQEQSETEQEHIAEPTYVHRTQSFVFAIINFLYKNRH